MKRNKMRAKMQNSRSSVNLTSVLVTAVFLSVAIVTADVTFTNRIKDISKDLGRALDIIMKENEIVYSNFTDDSVYVSEVDFHPKGMAGLYNITHVFMDLIQPKEIFPNETGTVIADELASLPSFKRLELFGTGLNDIKSNNLFTMTKFTRDLRIKDSQLNDDVQLTDESGTFRPEKVLEQWPALLRHYAGLLALTVVGLLFAVLMPLTGFCFCCCRCCGRCGARSQPFDKKHDMCRKVFLAMFLICIATLLLFGVVCSFVSNQHMQEGVEELPSNLEKSVKDVHTFINSTNSHMRVLLVKNYNELQVYLDKVLQQTGTVIADDLASLANAASFTRLELFVTGLNDIKGNLSTMANDTRDLRIKASQLNDGLRRVKYELLQTLKDCSSRRIKNCDEINDQVAKLGTTVDFDSLPDVTHEVSLLEQHISDELVNQIKDANEEFKKIPQTIQKEFDKSIPEIKTALKTAGDSLNDAYQSMNKLLTDVDKSVNDSTDDNLKQASYYIKEYSIYRYYVGLFMSCVLLLVILCVTFGLMCGICGKRPDGYDDDCCNKGAGSRFLMLGVAVMFLFSIVLMLITLVYFLSGVVMQRLVCDTLRNNETNNDNQVFKYLDKALNLEKLLHSDIQTVINSCHANETAYKVLRLDYMFNVSDISKYLNDAHLTEKLNSFVDQLEIKNVTILDDETTAKINKLKNSTVADLPIHRFVDILGQDLTSANLTYLADQLSNILVRFKSEPDTEDLEMSIKQNEMYLRMYQANLVEPMLEIANDLKEKATQIEKGLRFNEHNFTIAVEKTLEEVQSAQDYININGSGQMKDLAKVFGNNFTSKIELFLYRLANATEKDVGQCGPLSNVYNQTLVATCDKILNPWNGFWISVGWCLILFIPTIVLSVKLSTLYQKSDPYPGPLVEHEYLYDAYADRDNIPLSNSSNAKKGKKKKKSRGAGGGGADVSMYQQQAGGSGTEVRSRDAPGGSSHPDTRYADMAPKHWEDYPNGGPPQYQSAPLATEYERPPPYYYPGPGDRP